MALGEPLPKQILGHPWLLSGQDKMSKSKGNVMYADDLAKLFGVDAVRFYLLSEMPYAQDGNITYENIITRYNSELANTIGNLVNRTVAMINKYHGGKIFAPASPEPLDSELSERAVTAAEKFSKAMDEYKTADAVEAVMTLARRSNKYIDETMPWALAKSEEKDERLKTVLYNLTEAIRFIAVLLRPVMPESCESIFKQIGAVKTGFDSLKSFGATEPNSTVGEAKPLFNRIDEQKMLAEIEAEIDKKAAAAKAAEKQNDKKPGAPEGVAINIDDFQKVSLIAAEIISCEKVEKSDKLLKLMINDGSESERQVVSGIAQWYSPEQLVGKKIILVSNLKPAKLRGVLSNGMILAADAPDGGAKVIFLDDSIPAGCKIR